MHDNEPVTVDMGRRDVEPKAKMTNRGPGFFNSLSGHIVKSYGEALQMHGFRPSAGEDASQQPPDIPDLLLHETAIGWVRSYMRKLSIKTLLQKETIHAN